MLVVKFNNMDVELVKGEYTNGRFAVTMIDPKTEEQLTNLTVNIPEAMFYGETLGESECYEALINHIDGFNYDFILDWLEENNLINVNAVVGEVQSGFNFYKGVDFKSNVVSNMRSLDEVERTI